MSDLTTLLNQFRTFDPNDDLMVVRSEAIGMTSQLFDSIDKNKDGFIDLAEWFLRKDRPVLAKVTQKIFWNGIYDQTLPQFKENNFNSANDRISILVSLGVYLGDDFTTDKNKVSQFLSYTYWNNSLAAVNLPVLIEDLAKAGITSSEIIQTLVKKIVATDSRFGDYALQALPLAIESIIKAGIKDSEKIQNFIEIIISTAGCRTYNVFSFLPRLLDICGNDPKKLQSLIKKITASKSDPTATLAYLPQAIDVMKKAGIRDPEHIRILIERIAESSGGKTFDVLSSLPVVLNSSKVDYAQQDNFDKLINGLELMTISSISSIHFGNVLNYVFSDLKFNITEVNYSNFPKVLTSHLQEYVSKHSYSPDPQIFKLLSVWINQIHDFDMAKNKKDFLRQEIANNLDFRSAYLLIALGGNDLYTSSFLKIWDVQTQKKTNLLDEIKKADPKSLYVTDFILTLCNFGKADFLKNNSSFFLDKAIEVLGRDINVVGHSALLIKLFDTLLPMCGPDDKKRLNIFLNRAYLDGKKSKDYHNTMAFLIKLYAAKLGSKDLEKLASTLPAFLEPKIPREKWLRDGALTAKLYFYPDEQWLKWTGSYYKKKGWVKDTAYMQIRNIKDDDTVVYSKHVLDKSGKKVTLRVILTQSKGDDRVASINDDEFDIIAHRGHSFHIKDTFVGRAHIKAEEKLLIGGSCGSFRDMTDGDFLKQYSQNYLMADQNTGQGNMNNDAMTRLMEEVAKGSTDWNCIMSRGNEESGLVLPNDPSFLLGGYIKRLDK